MTRRCVSRFQVMFAAVAGVVAVESATTAEGAVISLQRVVAAQLDQNNAVIQLGAYAYKPGATPAEDQFFIAGSGSTGRLIRVDGANTGSTTSTLLVSDTQWQQWVRDNDPNANGTASRGQASVFGMLLNPVTIGSDAAYTRAWIVDQKGILQKGSPATDYPEKTYRFYSWNLQPALPASDPAAATNVFKPVLSSASLSTSAGAAATAVPVVSRQFVFSQDGQHIYFTDSSTTSGGLYQMDATTGALQRLITEKSSGSGTVRLTAEPGIRKVGPSTERIYTNGSTVTGNVGGINSVDFDYTAGTTTAASAVISGETITTFIGGVAGAGYDVTAIASDGENLYFDVNGGSTTGTTPTRRSVVLRLDAQGRLSKVVSLAERQAFFGTTVVGTKQFQFRDATYNGLPVRQLMFGQASDSTSYIGGVYLFEPGDFNQDGVVNAADGKALKDSGALKTMATTTSDTNSDNFRFDMNGDGYAGSGTLGVRVNYRDVKVFQQFLGFKNGDADFSLTLDFADLVLLGDNYLGTGKVWTSGDFNGDDLANFADLALLSNAWLGLGQAAPTLSQIDGAGFTSVYRDAVVTAFNVAVPEPSMLAMALPAVALLRRGRR